MLVSHGRARQRSTSTFHASHVRPDVTLAPIHRARGAASDARALVKCSMKVSSVAFSTYDPSRVVSRRSPPLPLHATPNRSTLFTPSCRIDVIHGSNLQLFSPMRSRRVRREASTVERGRGTGAVVAVRECHFDSATPFRETTPLIFNFPYHFFPHTPTCKLHSRQTRVVFMGMGSYDVVVEWPFQIVRK